MKFQMSFKLEIIFLLKIDDIRLIKYSDKSRRRIKKNDNSLKQTNNLINSKI